MSKQLIHDWFLGRSISPHAYIAGTVSGNSQGFRVGSTGGHEFAYLTQRSTLTAIAALYYKTGVLQIRITNVKAMRMLNGLRVGDGNGHFAATLEVHRTPHTDDVITVSRTCHMGRRTLNKYIRFGEVLKLKIRTP